MSKNRTDWYIYERSCVKYHFHKYGHVVWHWEDIPEIELYNAGFIHDFNEHRLLRLKRRKQRFRKDNITSDHENVHADIGFDGLIYDKTHDTYHGLQSKLWKKNKLYPCDLGTFMLKILVLKNKNTNSLGYLYHTTQLSKTLLEDCQLQSFIIQQKLEYNNQIVQNPKSEPDLKLYEHQRQALKNLKKDNTCGLKLLNMICATGKTIVAGRWLSIIKPKIIICMAPLRLHVDNLYSRIQPFLTDYESLLVDSDIGMGATTDPDEISDFLRLGNNRIIFTTYVSARNILSPIMKPKHCKYILVDEVHNITPNKQLLADFVNKFSDGLLMTATPYSNLTQIIPCTNVYSYSLSEAISDNVVCDYKVWVPTYSTDNEIICDIPTRFDNLDQEITQKVLFLCTGLLMTGSHKCIVYCRSKKECRLFREIFIQILNDYHGRECNINIIIDDTSNKERNEILSTFKSRSRSTYTLLEIIVSVRILDEAIDLPLCDSEFVTSVGSKNDIRMVQRLMRGGRKVDDNPFKVNNLFIWVDDIDRSLDIFTLLRSTDIHFSSKIQAMCIDYNAITNTVSNTHAQERTRNIVKFINTKCMSLDDLWEFRRQIWIKHDTCPDEIFSKGEIKKNKNWQRSQREFHKKGCLTPDRIKILEETPHWKWYDDRIDRSYTPEDKIELLIYICDKDAHIPAQSFIDPDTGIPIGRFLHKCLSGHHANLFEEARKRCAILENAFQQRVANKIKRSMIKKYTPEETMDRLIEMCNETGAVPTSKYKDTKTGMNIGCFLGKCRGGYHVKLYKEARKKCNILELDYQQSLQRIKERNRRKK